MTHPTPSRFFTLLAIVLFAAFVVGCAASPQVQVPTPTTVPEATAAPPPPTSTPTPQPATPTPDAAADLLREAQARHQSIKSARGSVEIFVDDQQTGQAGPVTMVMDLEYDEPDMKMSGQGLLSGQEVEAILKDDRVYIKVTEGQWFSLPAGNRSAQTPLISPVEMDKLRSYLRDAFDQRTVGRRTVKGVECEVIAFSLPQEKLEEVAQMRDQASGQRSSEDVVIEEFQGEVAISTEDKSMRQMIFEMSGYDKQDPTERFELRYSVTMWDFNSPDIMIVPPDPSQIIDFSAGSRPTPTPTPPPVPLHAYRSSTAPVVDGAITPEEGWEGADPVRGPYADGNIEIRALHDGEDLYLLLEWDDNQYKKAEGLNLVFEDGGTEPQGELDGENDDNKYVGVNGLPGGYRDATWEAGWRVGEQEDGVAAGGYGDGKMVVEWRGPLDSGRSEDISVSSDETLGFGVVNWSTGMAGQRGRWPAGASIYDPASWGSLVIHFEATGP